MLGISARLDVFPAIQQFFEIFKTPWEFYVPGHSYTVIISDGTIPAGNPNCPLILYSARGVDVDAESSVEVCEEARGSIVEWEEKKLPIYGSLVSLHGSTNRPLVYLENDSQRTVGCELHYGRHALIRLGYDLFKEVELLLSQGQPARNAHIPSLEIHIALLRAVIVGRGIPLIEIPPAPFGYDFLGCLTHDVDFVGIRDHKFDATMWGFLYRSLIASFSNACKGRLSWSKCFRNWMAALSLPFVHLGFKDDFWLEFDRYIEIEKELGSTFYFIPYRDVAGQRSDGPAPKRRAAKYDVMRLQHELRTLSDEGCEIGLHGIDAWFNVESACREQRRIDDATGVKAKYPGLRMHWLYWGEDSPKVLDAAGFSYDSTFGYNDAIGFRAGTAQPFCPSPAKHLLELPLTVQDSALFYPDRMNLSEGEAMAACKQIIASLASFGGVLTINWHTRSLSPERLWEEFYVELLRETQRHRIWFATAGQTVEWFRRRRAVRFDWAEAGRGYQIRMGTGVGTCEKPFSVRVHRSAGLNSMECQDIRWDGSEPIHVPVELSV